MMRVWGCLLPLLACACFWWGGQPGNRELVEDREILEFADTIGAFYSRLHNTRLDSLETYEDAELRTFFVDHREFSDYYASLAAQVRAAGFRRSRAEQVRIREFRFEGDDMALVDITLVGRHRRALRFWRIEIQRSDVWRRSAGTWALSPSKL